MKTKKVDSGMWQLPNRKVPIVHTRCEKKTLNVATRSYKIATTQESVHAWTSAYLVLYTSLFLIGQPKVFLSKREIRSQVVLFLGHLGVILVISLSVELSAATLGYIA